MDYEVHDFYNSCINALMRKNYSNMEREHDEDNFYRVKRPPKSAWLSRHAEYKKEKTTKNLTETKQTIKDNNMFDFNFGNMFNGMFGKLEKGKCAFAMNGGIAVKTSNGYKTYNIKKKRLTNVTNFCFDAADFFFVLPTAKVNVGDVILVGGKPKCVLRVNDDDKTIKVIDYENSEIREIVPERHIFMGAVVFYGKITSPFGNAIGGKGKGIMAKMMQLMMMKSMMGGDNGGNGGGNLMQMMMMQQFLGGGAAFGDGNMFENMFDVQFDEDTTAAVNPDAGDDDDDTTED